MMDKLKSNFIPVLSMSLLLVAVTLAACTSKEQQLKERQETLENFVKSVTQNVFDRNPQTIKESMGTLMRIQLSEKARNKLQAAGEIPDTELDVLKIIDDNQNKHISNKVEVDSVRALAPVEKNEVPFKVTGKSITLQDGKQVDDKVFSVNVIAQLTPEMGGYPRCTGIDGLPGRKTANNPASKTPTQAAPAGGKRRRHR